MKKIIKRYTDSNIFALFLTQTRGSIERKYAAASLSLNVMGSKV